MNQTAIQSIKGCSYTDERGSIFYNNELDFSVIKKMYLIENKDLAVVRAWQGHRIESRWFLVTAGSFCISIVKVDDWQNPSDDLAVSEYTISASTFDVLKVPPGFATSIQALENQSKLLAMSDYAHAEVDDNYKFNSNKWQKI